LLKAKIVGRLLDYFFDQRSPYNEEFRNMSTIKPRLSELEETGIPIHKWNDIDFNTDVTFNKSYAYLVEIISNCLRAIAN
jgi:hypothetical protein